MVGMWDNVGLGYGGNVGQCGIGGWWECGTMWSHSVLSQLFFHFPIVQEFLTSTERDLSFDDLYLLRVIAMGKAKQHLRTRQQVRSHAGPLLLFVGPASLQRFLWLSFESTHRQSLRIFVGRFIVHTVCAYCPCSYV